MSGPIEASVALAAEAAGAVDAEGAVDATSEFQVQMSWVGDAEAPGDVEGTVMFAASGTGCHSTLAEAGLRWAGMHRWVVHECRAVAN